MVSLSACDSTTGQNMHLVRRSISTVLPQLGWNTSQAPSICCAFRPVVVYRGADKSCKNADGKTALEVAQLNEQEDVIKVLEDKKE